jgi:hypothetical protein
MLGGGRGLQMLQKLSNVWVSMVYSLSFFHFMFTKFPTMYAVQSHIFSDMFVILDNFIVMLVSVHLSDVFMYNWYS